MIRSEVGTPPAPPPPSPSQLLLGRCSTSWAWCGCSTSLGRLAKLMAALPTTPDAAAPGWVGSAANNAASLRKQVEEQMHQAGTPSSTAVPPALCGSTLQTVCWSSEGQATTAACMPCFSAP